MELLNLAKKTDLLNITDHYALTFAKPSMLKCEFKNILIEIWVDEEILDPRSICSIFRSHNSNRHTFGVVLDRAYRGLTGGFLLLRNFSGYFCESSCLFYLSFNFDFYVSKIINS